MPYDDEETLKQRRKVSASFMGQSMPEDEPEMPQSESSQDRKKLDEIAKRRRALLANRSKP